MTFLIRNFCCYLVILLMVLVTSFFAFDIVLHANVNAKIRTTRVCQYLLCCEKRELPGSAYLLAYVYGRISAWV